MINPRSRPNKLALGMTRTWDRTKTGAGYPQSHIGDDACLLSVRGTLDQLGAARYYYLQRVDSSPCTHCGQTRKVVRLNDKGRARLARMRRDRGYLT